MGFKSHIWKKKKKPGLVRVRPGHPGSGSPRFGRAVATAGLLLNPDRSSHRVDPPGRAGFNNSGNNCSNRLCCLCGRLILVGLVCFCVLKMFLKKNNFLYFFLCFKLMCFFFVFLDYFADINNNFFLKKYFFLIHFYIKSILKNNTIIFPSKLLVGYIVQLIVTFYVFSTVCRKHRVLLQIILRHWILVMIFQ